MQEINKILNCRKEVIFLDFEGTQFSQEIFAIGAIKVLLDNKNRVNKKSSPFKVYVKTQNKIGSIIEKLTGFKNLKENIEIGIQMTGFALIIMLSIYVAYNDVLRVF